MGRSKQGLLVIVGIVLVGVSTWVPDTSGAGVTGDDRLSVVSGGIGKEEADRLRAMAPEYPLELVFVRRVEDREEFIADVRLSIADAAGRLLVDRASGPIVLIRVPAGVYTISAESGGQVKTRRVAVSDARHEKIALVWS